MDEFEQTMLLDAERWYLDPKRRDAYDLTNPEVKAIRDSSTLMLPSVRVRDRVRSQGPVPFVFFALGSGVIVLLYLFVPIMVTLGPFVPNTLYRVGASAGLILVIEWIVTAILLRISRGFRAEGRNVRRAARRAAQARGH